MIPERNGKGGRVTVIRPSRAFPAGSDGGRAPAGAGVLRRPAGAAENWIDVERRRCIPAASPGSNEKCEFSSEAFGWGGCTGGVRLGRLGAGTASFAGLGWRRGTPRPSGRRRRKQLGSIREADQKPGYPPTRFLFRRSPSRGLIRTSRIHARALAGRVAASPGTAVARTREADRRTGCSRSPLG